MLTLAIRGLVAIVYRPGKPGKYEALLNPGHGHIPTLSAFTDFLDPKGLDKPWLPDAFGYAPVIEGKKVSEFKQVAIWKLAGKKVKFFGNPGTLKNWDDRNEAVDFDSLHPQSKSSGPTNGFVVFELDEGQPSSERLRTFKVTGPNGTTEMDLATEIRWSGLRLELEANDQKRIRFKKDISGMEPAATLSNVAPEADPEKALKHFEHYYHVLRDKNDKEFEEAQRFKIAPVKRLEPATRRTDETYDCVPPGAMPPLP
jgi:hypothetical protein